MVLGQALELDPGMPTEPASRSIPACRLPSVHKLADVPPEPGRTVRHQVVDRMTKVPRATTALASSATTDRDRQVDPAKTDGRDRVLDLGPAATVRIVAIKGQAIEDRVARLASSGIRLLDPTTGLKAAIIKIVAIKGQAIEGRTDRLVNSATARLARTMDLKEVTARGDAMNLARMARLDRPVPGRMALGEADHRRAMSLDRVG
jgi:hypothetical protein